MMWHETVLDFHVGNDTLAGVVCSAATSANTAVLIVVGGPQYRAGSHRQFVLLARALATAGFATMRFDVRGMGDSDGDARSFEALDDDIAAAIEALAAAVPARRVVLWGLCDGASAALLYLHRRRDPRVAGLCLANPWVRSDHTLARTHIKHYYLQRLRQREFWSKLASGQVAWAALCGLLANVRTSLRAAQRDSRAAAVLPYQQAMARALAEFGGPVLLLLSGCDHTAQEFLEAARIDNAWQTGLARSNVTRRDLSGADHTFSDSADRQLAERYTVDWLCSLRDEPSAPSHLHEAIDVAQ